MGGASNFDVVACRGGGNRVIDVIGDASVVGRYHGEVTIRRRVRWRHGGWLIGSEAWAAKVWHVAGVDGKLCR